MADQDPHAQCSIHKGKEYHSAPLRSKGSETYVKLPSAGDLHQEEEPL